VSILDDMGRAQSLAVRAKEWRIGLNAWHALLADLHHRGVCNVALVTEWPTTLGGLPIFRVSDHTSWELVADGFREPPDETHGDCG